MGDGAVKPRDDLCARPLVSLDDGLVVLGIQASGQRGRPDQVNKHHRQLTAFADGGLDTRLWESGFRRGTFTLRRLASSPFHPFFLRLVDFSPFSLLPPRERSAACGTELRRWTHLLSAL